MAKTKRRLTFREKVEDEASKMNNEVFFTSNEVMEYLTRWVTNILTALGLTRTVVVKMTGDRVNKWVARTNSRLIEVNVLNSIIQAVKARLSQFHLIRGLILHEVMHIVYTDFGENERITRGLLSGRCLLTFTYPDLQAAADEFNRYISVIKNPLLLKITAHEAHQVMNILEDPYVNARPREVTPGLAMDLEEVLSIDYEDTHTLTDLLAMEKDPENPMHPFFTMLDLMRSYAFFGEYKCESWQYKNDRIRALEGLEEWVELTINTHDRKERTDLQFGVFLLLFPYFKEYMEDMIKKYGNEAPEKMSSDVAGREASGVGSVREAPSGSSMTPEEAEKVDSRTKAKAAEKARAKKEEGSEGASSDKASGSPGAPTGPSHGSETVEDAGDADGDGDSGEQSEEDAERPLSLLSESPEEEDGPPERRIPFSELRKEDKRSAAYDKAEKDMERLLEKACERKAMVRTEEEKLEDIQLRASAIKHGAIHNGAKCRIERRTEVTADFKAKFEKSVEETEVIARRLAGEVEDLLMKRRKGEVRHNLPVGRRLDFPALIRHDGKAMMRRTLPSNYPQLAVAVLCDESGSTRGVRIAAERFAAEVLYLFCRALDYRVGVFGFKTPDPVTVITSYAEFESVDEDDKYRIMEMEAGKNNRDGLALRYVAERLAEEKADIRLLFMVSDGQPAAAGYSGRAACEDLANVVQDAQKDGVTVIGCAIGDDKDAIKSIYGDNFLNIDDLDTLPKVLTDIVRAYAKL